MFSCFRMSLEQTTEKDGFSFGAFHQVEFAQNNKKDSVAECVHAWRLASATRGGFVKYQW